jgi:hypothetical protein
MIKQHQIKPNVNDYTPRNTYTLVASHYEAYIYVFGFYFYNNSASVL